MSVRAVCRWPDARVRGRSEAGKAILARTLVVSRPTIVGSMEKEFSVGRMLLQIGDRRAAEALRNASLSASRQIATDDGRVPADETRDYAMTRVTMRLLAEGRSPRQQPLCEVQRLGLPFLGEIRVAGRVEGKTWRRPAALSTNGGPLESRNVSLQRDFKQQARIGRDYSAGRWLDSYRQVRRSSGTQSPSPTSTSSYSGRRLDNERTCKAFLATPFHSRPT